MYTQSLEEMLAKLTADFEKATADKLRCQKEADATQATIQLANRLVGGLASENVRWAEAVAEYVKNICLLMLIYLIYLFFLTQQIHGPGHHSSWRYSTHNSIYLVRRLLHKTISSRLDEQVVVALLAHS